MKTNIPDGNGGTYRYCEKHNQRYMGFLHACPICVGERMTGLPRVPLGRLTIDEDLIPNKMGLYAKDIEEKPEGPMKPEQLSLFE